MNNFRLLWVLLLSFMLGACSLGGPSRPSQFYVLSTEPGVLLATVATDKQLSIGVGPIFLPDILDRPQIVTRVDSNRIALAEFDRWGGDLNKNLLRVLSQNLMQRLSTDNIVTFPWKRQENPDLQVSIRFFDFDGTLGKQVVISGIWQVLDGEQGCLLAARRFDLTETPADSSYAGFVDALSHAVAGLSQAIAEKLAVTSPGC
jgi:uncharacterized lipoprotein YmbA